MARLAAACAKHAFNCVLSVSKLAADNAEVGAGRLDAALADGSWPAVSWVEVKLVLATTPFVVAPSRSVNACPSLVAKAT